MVTKLQRPDGWRRRSKARAPRSRAGSSDRTDEGFRKNRKYQLYTLIFLRNFGFRAAKSRYTVRIFDDFYEIDWKFGFSWKMRYTLCVFDDFQNFDNFIKIFENANCIPHFFSAKSKLLKNFIKIIEMQTIYRYF